MKKFLLLSAILLVGLVSLVPKPANAKTLYDCYQSKGLAWEKQSVRAVKAAEVGIFHYKGTAAQNTALSNVMCSDKLGYSVATGYQKTLKIGASASQSFFVVSSLLLKDGTTLSAPALGDKIFLDIEPGATKEEIVMCSDIDVTSTKFTGCTRGLAFSGTSTASNSSIAYPHNASSIIVMSNVHYVYEQYVDVNAKNQTITGDKFTTGTWTYSLFPKTTSSIAIPTNANELATKYYVDNVGAGGFTANNVSNTRGTFALGTSPETVGIRPSTTLGMVLDSAGNIYQKTSSSLAVGSDINGIYIITNTLSSLISSLPNAATSTPTASKIPIADGSGTLDSWVTVTNTFNYVPNTITDNNLFFSSIIPTLNNSSTPGGTGWTGTENAPFNGVTVNRYANFASTTNFNSACGCSFYTNLMGTSTYPLLQFQDYKEIRLKWRMKIEDHSGTPQGDSGFGLVPDFTSFRTASTSVLAGERIMWNHTSAGRTFLSLVSSSGGAASTTNIASLGSIRGDFWHTFEIIHTSSSVKYYIDSVLKATHTSVITSGTVFVGWGAANSGDTISMAISDVIVTQGL